MTRVTKKPEVRKQELIDIAQKLFIAKGYEATSVRDILHEVDGAPGMFYHHFSSKEEIYKVAMAQYVDGYVEKIKSILNDKTVPVSERVQNLLQLIKKTFTEYLSASSVSHYSPECFAAVVIVSMKILNQVANSLDSFIVELIGNGLVSDSMVLSLKTRQLALFILYGIYGILHDGSEDEISTELIDKNLSEIVPLVSSVLKIPLAVLLGEKK